MPRQPERIDGYAPIADYAAIGNERSAALVALDGSIDWLCFPSFDSPSLFAAILDPARGGRFALAPSVPYQAERRYIEDTNVLETTFTTSDGAVRVIDVLTMHVAGPLPWQELARRVEGLSGEVPMRWLLEPRFHWGKGRGTLGSRHDVPFIVWQDQAVALLHHGAGEPQAQGEGALAGELVARGGERALLAMRAFHQEPLLLSRRDAVEERVDETIGWWKEWSRSRAYEGPWRESVTRSALALALLVYQPTGSIAAAATTSLPERIGGDRNWDYRFSWLRDTCFTLEAVLRMGHTDQVHASLAWILRSIRGTHPRLQVFYCLDGTPWHDTVELDLDGYRGSRPVRVGNDAMAQLQLGNYGDLMQTAWLYVDAGNALDTTSGHSLADVADFVCEVWQQPDASIWELPEPRDYTQGKVSAWLALDRAARLADEGQLPAGDSERWRREAAKVRDYIETRCWSDARRCYLRRPGSDELDASLLLAARVGYLDGPDPRLVGTIDALREELAVGPLLYRYSGAHELEGAFLACSFWLAEALARAGRVDEAGSMMDELVGLANDVGLFSEEMDPHSGEMLGNFPQALTHLSLVNAAHVIREAAR